MTLEENILKKLNRLKPTITKVYSNTGEVYEEFCNEEGKFLKKRLDQSTCGYIIDHSPDLSLSPVLPWLFIGSQDVAHDYNILKLNKISHILSIGVSSPIYDNISTTFIEAYDLDDFDIERLFIPCSELINEVRKSSGRILVHCNAGISRSATVVAAYLIQYYGISHTEALEKLKMIRPKINPNQGFVKKLKNFAKAK